jgi:hypothetical protein
MLQRTFLLACGLGLSFATQGQTVFREDFNPGTSATCDTAPGAGNLVFPPGWLLRNVDNRTPAANVAYINEAWEVREDFAGEVTNCVAFSTSFYAPVGQADDWMWSPPIGVPAGAVLRWRAKAYDVSFRDGYEVRVMTSTQGPPTGGAGAIGNQVANSTVLFTTAAEATTWTAREVSLSAFAGQSVYIGFRNNTNDRFIVVIDDVEVAVSGPDLRATDPVAPGPWARIPAGLASAYALGVGVRNAGSVAIGSASVTATPLRDGVVSGTTLNSTPVGAIAIGGTATATWPAQSPGLLASGTWSTRYVIAAPAGEISPADNTIESRTVTVGGSELSRYTSDVASTLGIGAGNGGEIATVIEVPAPLRVVGVRLRMEGRSPITPPAVDQWTGRPIVARIRAADPTGVPQDPVLAETQAGVGTRDAQIYDLALASPITLPAGRYAVSAVEPTESEAMTLALHLQIYEATANRVTWPTSPAPGWSTLETFGLAFARTPQIGLLTSLDLYRDGFEPAASPAATIAPQSLPDARHRSGLPAWRLVDFVEQ